MTSRIHISIQKGADPSYDIIIGDRLQRALGIIAAKHTRQRIFVITDSNISRIYGATVRKALPNGTLLIVVPAGERSKSRAMKEKVENKLLSLRANRDSLIIALGGGVVGDLAGFVAATFMRGIPYIQVPTSLLAQVDSSVGGKVAVDHPLGKNLIGAFYQPEAVYIDPQMLTTLPDRQFKTGMAEVIKYGAILDADFFGFLECHPNLTSSDEAKLAKIVHRCCELKKMVVEKDEKEWSYRRILNFGHTIGHAVEKEAKYRLLHGEAIAIGMVAEARISSAVCGFLMRDFDRLQQLLTAFMLPTALPRSIRFNRIVASTILDKKAVGGNVQYTLLEQIGKATVGVSLKSSEVKKILSA